MDTEENWSVYCFAEECPSTPCVVEAGRGNAIAAWNTRHPAEPSVPVAKLRALVEEWRGMSGNRSDYNLISRKAWSGCANQLAALLPKVEDDKP